MLCDHALNRAIEPTISHALGVEEDLRARLTAAEALLKDQDAQLRTWVRINEEHNQDFALMRQRAETAEQQRDALQKAVERAGVDLIGFESHFERDGSMGTVAEIRATLKQIDAALALLSSQREPQQPPGDQSALPAGTLKGQPHRWNMDPNIGPRAVCWNCREPLESPDHIDREEDPCPIHEAVGRRAGEGTG